LSEQTYHKLAGGRLGLRLLKNGTALPPLVCFPHAGAHSLAFRPFARFWIPPHPVWAVDPPGHGAATGRAMDDIAALSAELVTHLPRRLTHQSVLFGHSFGAYLALALAQRLTRSGQPPRGLVLSGAQPPSERAESPSLAALDDRGLFDRLARFGASPAAWGDVFPIFAASIRADLVALYRHQVLPDPVGCPVLVLGGAQDDFATPARLGEWRALVPDAHVAFVPGRHLFIETDAAAAAARVGAFVESLL
jgi:surfactin synthase thioesterase subunit